MGIMPCPFNFPYIDQQHNSLEEANTLWDKLS